MLGWWQSATQRVSTGIPQGSPISPILFLFFNADLVELCSRRTCRVSGLGFVDNVNILAYGTSTEGNCQLLERVHRDCLSWAARHRATFAPQKYKLMHLTRSPKRFNMAATLRLPDSNTKEPSPTVRVLGVLLDSKLRWGPHIKRTINRAAQQSWALTALSASTW